MPAVCAFTCVHTRPAVWSGVSPWVAVWMQCIHPVWGLHHDTADTHTHTHTLPLSYTSCINIIDSHKRAQVLKEVLSKSPKKDFRSNVWNIANTERQIQTSWLGLLQTARETWKVCLSSVWSALWLEHRHTNSLILNSQMCTYEWWANANSECVRERKQPAVLLKRSGMLSGLSRMLHLL